MDKNLQILCDKALNEKEKSIHFRSILRELENKKDQYAFFWHYREMAILLLQQIITCYPLIGKDKFTNEVSSGLCTIMNIYQIIVIDDEVRHHFMTGQYLFYFYPFMNIDEVANKYETVKICCVCIIGALLNVSMDETVTFLKYTEMVPLSLKIMDLGTEVAKVVTIHLFYKILSTESGLDYMVQTYDRYITIAMTFNSIIYQLVNMPSNNVLSLILDCFILMCSRDNVLMNMHGKPPDALLNNVILGMIERDAYCKDKFDLFMKLIKR